MHVDDGLAPVQLLEYWLVSRIAEPFVAVTALQADPVGFQTVERIFDLLESGVDVQHRQRREQAEATRMVAHHFGRVFIARAGEPAGFRWPDVEPHTGGGGERQYAYAYAILIHVLDHLIAGPGDLPGEVR